MFDLLEKLRQDPRRLEVLGDGDQARDYCYIADTVAALLLIGACSDARGGVYNVAGGKPTRVRDLVHLLVQAIGITPPEVTYTHRSWRGDIKQMIGDTTALRALDWRPETDLVHGLPHLVEWHRAEFHPPW
jgi:UDP-glucose 4-epimerase